MRLGLESALGSPYIHYVILLKRNMEVTQDYLLFTDTDSLMYEIKTEDVCKDFSNDKKCFILVTI